MPDLYIVRHGNTFDSGDTILRVGGRTDLDLSRSGMEQATALGTHFSDLDLKPARILAGPLKRTLQTAEAITSALGVPVAVVDERLREVDYGPDEGQPEEAVIARIGKAALAAWEDEGRVPDGWQVDAGALVQAWREILAETAMAGGDTLAVTSNGVARFALHCASSRAGHALKLKTGAYGIIKVSGEIRQVTAWNVRP